MPLFGDENYGFSFLQDGLIFAVCEETMMVIASFNYFYYFKYH